jgi:hypothetical protein
VLYLIYIHEIHFTRGKREKYWSIVEKDSTATFSSNGVYLFSGVMDRPVQSIQGHLGLREIER